MDDLSDSDEVYVDSEEEQMEEDDMMADYYYNVLRTETRASGSQTKNTSILEGSGWMVEILTTRNHDQFYYNVRMSRDYFFALVNMLRERGFIHEDHRIRLSCAETVLIFLRTVLMHLRFRDTEEHFQHSMHTISTHFHMVLDALIALSPELIVGPDFTRIPDRILNDTKMFPFFEHCVGALDGTLIPAHVPISEQTAYRSRKGSTLQNVLAIVDFDMKFTYICIGWEGSAHDARALMHTVMNDHHFPYPPNVRYYLVDAGYTNYDGFLAPYRGTRYNLPEFNNGGIQPTDEKELFNHRHSQLQNCVERAFGVLKSRFPLLRYGMPNFKITDQKKIVMACCVLHNWIKQSDIPDDLFLGLPAHFEEDDMIFSDRCLPKTGAREAQGEIRDAIAVALWNAQAGPAD